jgi:hypothetical protein
LTVIRVVFAERTTRDDLDDWAHERGCRLIAVVPPASDRPGQSIFRDADRQTLVYLIDDARAPAPVAIVAGPGESDVVRAFRDRLPVTLDEPFAVPEGAA